VGGTNYHLILQPDTTVPAQSLSFTYATQANYNAATTFGGCGFIGVVKNADLDAAVKALINGPLAGLVNAGTIPIFLTRSVVQGVGTTNIFGNCCILGYHNSFTNSMGQVQTYSPFTLDTSRTFGGDVSILSHEIGELINDPLVGSGATTNFCPTFGNIGQVGGCQTNFEVGDPLTGTLLPAIVAANGLTYHMQELAFFNWFYGPDPVLGNLGVGGKYSNNGHFSGDAKNCPPGGTN
jgi:hypothetical protein